MEILTAGFAQNQSNVFLLRMVGFQEFFWKAKKSLAILWNFF
jgi:hypothetical protein